MSSIIDATNGVRSRRCFCDSPRPRRARARRAGGELRAVERPRPARRVQGIVVPGPLRIAQLSQELEVLTRGEGIARALKNVSWTGRLASQRPAAAAPAAPRWRRDRVEADQS